jgi:hypothetical protein
MSGTNTTKKTVQLKTHSVLLLPFYFAYLVLKKTVLICREMPKSVWRPLQLDALAVLLAHS